MTKEEQNTQNGIKQIVDEERQKGKIVRIGYHKDYKVKFCYKVGIISVIKNIIFDKL